MEKLYQGKELNSQDTKLLASLFSKERIQSVMEGDDAKRDKLIEDLLDQHGPGRVLFRNTRSAMTGFPTRKVHLSPLTSPKDQHLWIQRVTKELAYELDPGNKPGEQHYWFEEDPRVKWLLALTKELFPSKVLLICKSIEKVLALEKALAKHSNLKAGVFHEDLTIVQRDRNAAWFSEPDGAQLLLCSEIGSEGRNFQFAHHLILFDLPLHPELLEQRIGRLDRIGQTEEIHIHTPYLAQSPQEVLVRWFQEGMNAFEENLEGGNEISKLFNDRLLNSIRSFSDTIESTELEALINDTKVFRKELQKRLADGRDRLLEMNSYRPRIAQKLIEQIQAQDNDRSLENYLLKVFRHFDIELEDLASRSYFLQPASVITETFPFIPPEGISVTFDRKRALSREEISFLSWDHPLVTSSIDRVLSSGTGCAGFGILRGTHNPGILLEIIYILETTGEQSIYVDRFMPNIPLRIVVDQTGKEVTDHYPVESFNKKLTPGSMDELLDNQMLMETIVPNMISAAAKIAEEKSITERAKGLKHMNLTLNHEIDRLRKLQKKNRNIRSEEIQTALTEQTTLSTLINNARVRMDAIQLILKE